MADMKRTYTIPLRKEWLNVANYKRAKRAAKAVRLFLKRHMKGDVKIGRRLNMLLWQRGAKHPPHHVKVDATKDEKNIVKAEITGFAYEEQKVPEQEKGKLQETLQLLTGKKGDEKKEEKPAEEVKPEQKPAKLKEEIIGEDKKAPVQQEKQKKTRSAPKMKEGK